MLQFILGRASSGKTYTVTEKIAECIQQGKSPVLLVPEQFSFESEKNILDRVGDGDAQRVAVISFTRLCDEIERENGGVCGNMMSDTDKIILMGRAIGEVRENLIRWRRYAASSSFAKMMVETVSEFKLNAITYDELFAAAERTDSEQLRSKLLDTAMIYEQYEAIIHERFIDSSDRLTATYYALQNYRYFEGKTVFIDSFKSFSGQQYKIIDRILSQADDVFVTLTDNPKDSREFGLFSNIKRVINRISRSARSSGMNIGEPIILDTKHYESEELSLLEDFMCIGDIDCALKCKDITVCAADSIYSEADFVARSIRRIVRENGARYSDFVIIARDTAPYEDAVETACRKNGISCFIDRPLPLCSQPPVVATLAALRAAQSFNTENILHFLKSGIGILELDEITELENYVYIWNIDGKDWLKEWDMNPNGLDIKKNNHEENEQRLELLNTLRERAIGALLTFKNEFCGSARTMSRAVVNLLEGCNARESFLRLSGEFKSDNKTVYADSIKQAWGKLMSVLNSLTDCFGERELGKKEYIDAFALAVSLETVGVIPQMIDEVIFGAADRIRPSRPKYAFIMGANAGVFPAISQLSGLFLPSERTKLIELELEIPDKTFSSAIDEEHLLYSNVCCASRRVFISYKTNGGSEPSAFVEAIKNRFDYVSVREPSALCESNLPETAEDAFSRICATEHDDIDTVATVAAATECIKPRVDAVLNNRKRASFSLESKNALSLFGKRLYMSATKYDTFSKCHFRYFCEHGLNIKRLEKVDFSIMQKGTLLHYILQRVIEENGKAVSTLSDGQIYMAVERYADEYLDSVPGYRTIENGYMRYLLSTLKRSARFVIKRLADEFAQSDFEPVKCELSIRRGGDIPQLNIPIDEGFDMEFTGFVDRVDKWNGYVRIIDYKSGGKDFALSDVLVGQNMQMLLYLYAISRDSKYGGIPAGVLYMPAKRDRENSRAKRRMKGLLANEDSVIYAMDKSGKGEFVPSAGMKGSYIEPIDFDKIFAFIDLQLKKTGKEIFDGKISAEPLDGISKKACEYCDLKNVCRIENEKIPAVQRQANRDILDEMERQVSEGGI